MNRRVICLMLLVMLVVPPSALSGADPHMPYESREGNLSIGLGMFSFPYPSVEVLKVSPFGVSAAYGLTPKLEAVGTFAPLNYYTAMILPDMISAETYLFIYVAEAGLRYSFSRNPGSFYVEADLANLGIFGNLIEVDLLEAMSGGIFFGGGGFGFSGQAGDALLSVGLHGYYLLGYDTESDALPVIPILKFQLLW